MVENCNKEIDKEDFIQKLEEAFEWMKKQPVEIIGTKANPYYCYCNNEIYKKVKEELPLDENDMYCTICGWVKVINVDKPFEVEVKPYEPKFNNTNHKPFYHDVFKENKNDYAVKVLGKWKKK